MHLETYGAGSRAVLAIHGWGGDHREFAPIAARRPADGCLLSVDLPGYGKSPPPVDWTPGGLAGALAEALEARGTHPLPIAAFCSGAFPALLLARDYPHLVSRLLLIDPFARVPWYFRHFTWGWFGRRAYDATFHGFIGKALTNGVLRRRQASDADFTAAFAQLDTNIVLRYMKLFARHGDGRAFSGLTLPIDLVYGERTFRAVRSGVRLFARQWPQARVHRLEGVGHLPLIRGARRLAALAWEHHPPCPADR